MTSSARHVGSLTAGESVFEGELGSVRRVGADSLPIMKRLSIKRLTLAPGAVREPHWHANASELTYCLGGELLVSILDDGSAFSSFTLSVGEMFHVASGSLHHIENIGETEAELIVAFRHERPEDFSLHGAFGAMSDDVLGNTYDLPAEAFAAIPRSTAAAYIVGRDGAPVVPDRAGFGDPHRFAVEAQSAPVETHFLVFFDQPTPGDVGYRAAASAYSREVLAATLGIAPADLPALPDTRSDPLIVGRINPLSSADPGGG